MSNELVNEQQLSHQEIGQQLELFMTHEATTGSIFLLPNGTKIWRALEGYLRNEYKLRGYEEVMTPQIANVSLWKQSGHWSHYKENMFCVDVDNNKTETKTKEEQENSIQCLKPMNCAFHCLIFNNTLRSYKNLPMRLADFGCLHRNEPSGSIRGLQRLKKFCQDDAHIFCRPDQITEEITNCLRFLNDVYNLFGFEYEIFLSTRPDKFMGDIEIWIEAERNLMAALDSMKLSYTVNEKDGAFYGPKIDIMLKDSAGRKVQCGTIQLDFQLPQNFNLEYVDYDAQRSTPVIIHRAILGSVERMMGVLLEHFQGKMPMWLSPRQVAIVPVANKPEFAEYCAKLKSELLKFDNRLDSIQVFDSTETFSYRIRDAETKLYNYVLIVGKKEIDSNCVTFRIMNHKRNDVVCVPMNEVCEIIAKSHFDITL